MIEFQGKLSHESKRILKIKKIITTLIIEACYGLLLVLPLILLTIFWRKEAIAFLIIAIIFLGLEPLTNSEICSYPYKITIDEVEMISYSDKTTICMPLTDVKRIVDRGHSYDIIFNFPKRNNSFICQKDLITQGSIEEFEQLFKDKIIRMIKD